jgi:hypothetical protein
MLLLPYPNIETIMVVAFLAALFLPPAWAMIVPLCALFITDIFIGHNWIFIFTYSGFAMVTLVTLMGRDKFGNALSTISPKSVAAASGFGVMFVLIYDVWTNFGWWLLMYPHTLQTLALVYALGLPFMIYHLISGIMTFTLIALPVVSIASAKHSWTILFPHARPSAYGSRRVIACAAGISLIMVFSIVLTAIA